MRHSLSILLILTVTLLGCGKDSGGGGTVPGRTGEPQISYPANALVSDYTCVHTSTYRVSGGAVQTYTYTESGISREWSGNLAGQTFDYDEDSDGTFKSYTDSRRDTVDEKTYHVVVIQKTWYLYDGNWEEENLTIEKVMKTENGIKTAISHKVNGVETPYYYQIQGQTPNPKTYIEIRTNTKPELKNSGSTEYLSDVQTCTYIDR